VDLPLGILAMISTIVSKKHTQHRMFFMASFPRPPPPHTFPSTAHLQCRRERPSEERMFVFTTQIVCAQQRRLRSLARLMNSVMTTRGSKVKGPQGAEDPAPRSGRFPY
jgi:hypothetical protein